LVLASLTVQVPGIVLAPCFTCCQWWLLVFINRNFLSPGLPAILSISHASYNFNLCFQQNVAFVVACRLVAEVVQFYYCFLLSW
jgi:hypothetical protein